MMFTDGSPVMILSQLSLEYIDNKYTEEHLEMDRFRPNIVLSGCKPFAEVSVHRNITVSILCSFTFDTYQTIP